MFIWVERNFNASWNMIAAWHNPRCVACEHLHALTCIHYVFMFDPSMQFSYLCGECHTVVASASLAMLGCGVAARPSVPS